MRAKGPSWRRASLLGVILLITTVMAACAPAAAPTPTPIPKAPTPPPAATPTPAPKPAETPAAKPAATPTTAAPAKPTGAPIKIGFLTPLTGRMAPLGQIQKYAVQAAVEEVNAAGGINGRPLEVVTEDSPFDPKQTVTLVRKVTEQDKVLAIIGPYSSGEYEVAAPLANDLKLPLMSTTSIKPGIPGKNRPWAFRWQITDDVTLPVALEAFKKVYPTVKKVVITGDTKEAVNQYVVTTLFPKLLKEKGYEVLDTVAFETGTTDFSAVVTRIKGLNPEGLALSALTPEALGLAKEMVMQGLKKPVVTGMPIWNEHFYYVAKEAGEGWVSVGVVNQDDPDPRLQKFLKRFRELAQPDPAVVEKPARLTAQVNAYDAILALADIMRKANITPETPLAEARSKIRDALQGLKDYKALVGNVTVLPDGETGWKPFPFLAKGGNWEVVK